jgi:CRISPR-associated endonuclease Csn1
MSQVKKLKTVLGLDLGSNSLGWSLIEHDKGSAGKIIDMGVRVFEAGMEGDIERGRAESRNKIRREKRLIRRQYNKRRCPWYHLEAQTFRLLQNVNNLRLQEYNGALRELTPQERELLVELLEENTYVTYA